jgi:CBS domain-containing protein
MHELMKSPMVSCTGSAALSDVATLMGVENVGCVLVLDEHGRLSGIVTDRDLAVRGLGAGLTPGTPVEAVMTRDVVWASEGVDIFEAATRMAEHGCRRLPLLDAEGRVNAVLTLDDLLPVFIRQLDKIARTVSGTARAPTGPV